MLSEGKTFIITESYSQVFRIEASSPDDALALLEDHDEAIRLKLHNGFCKVENLSANVTLYVEHEED